MNHRKWLEEIFDRVNMPKEVHIQHQPKKRGSFVRGAFIGTALGAVAGMLFAPKTGKETRKNVQKTGENLQKEATKQVNQLTKKVQRRVDTAQQRTRSKVAETATKVQNKVEPAIDEAAKQAKRSTRKTARTARSVNRPNQR